MGSAALPPPDFASQGGLPPGGGFPSPAPSQGDNGAARKLDLVQGIVANARMLAQMDPSVTPEVRQINDLLMKVQQKLVQGQPASATQAPPV